MTTLSFHVRLLSISSIIMLAGCSSETKLLDTDNRKTAVHQDAVEQTDNRKLAEQAAPNISDQAFRDAAQQGDLAIVKRAIEQGVDLNTPDADGRTALMWAAFDGHTEVVRTLLQHKVQVDRRDAVNRTALIYAASGKNPGAVTLLLKAGANVDAVDNQEKWSALMFAAAEGNINVVRVLLKHGANTKLTDIDGETALQFAASRGHREVVGLLQGE